MSSHFDNSTHEGLIAQAHPPPVWIHSSAKSTVLLQFASNNHHIIFYLKRHINFFCVFIPYSYSWCTTPARNRLRFDDLYDFGLFVDLAFFEPGVVVGGDVGVAVGVVVGGDVGVAVGDRVGDIVGGDVGGVHWSTL